jgi:hypothetical protein
MPLGTDFRGTGLVIPADTGTALIDGTKPAAVVLSREKRTIVFVMAIVRGNHVIAGPDHVIVFQNLQDILPALSLPTGEVFLGDIGRDVGETAYPATSAWYAHRSHLVVSGFMSATVLRVNAVPLPL